MARIRSIHPGLASDEAFMSMSMAAKAAWAILWTECDDHGVFEWKPIVLKARIFPADNVDVGEILSEYETLNCVRKFEVDGKWFGCIRNFCKFQRPKKPSYRYQLPNDLNLYAAHSPTTSPPIPNQFPTSGGNLQQMKEEGGEVRDGETRAREPSITPEAFELSDSILKSIGEDRESPDWYGFPYLVQTWLAEKIPKDFIISTCANLRGKHRNYLDKAVRNGWRDRQNEQQTQRKVINGSAAGNILQAQDRILEKLAEFDRPIGAREICGTAGETNVRLLSQG